MRVLMRYTAAIEAGQVDLQFRRWKRSQVVAGRVYRTAAGRLEVLSVKTVNPTRISNSEAKRSGHPNKEALFRAMKGDETLPTYRIEIRPATDPDPRAALAAASELDEEDIADIDRRLDRLDQASSWGAWTASTLLMIRDRPGVVALELATSVGRERDPFKLDVRKLKSLGLTHSLSVGYELSPRGTAYLTQSNRNHDHRA